MSQRRSLRKMKTKMEEEEEEEEEEEAEEEEEEEEEAVAAEEEKLETTHDLAKTDFATVCFTWGA
jgi:hypothetical protein